MTKPSIPTAPAVLLDVDRLTMCFGGLTAVDQVSFQALTGQITAIIGPNGAGKTTLFNCLTGFYRPTAGSMRLFTAGHPVELAGQSAQRSAQRGIARTFQNIRLFASMTVLENLMVAQHRKLMPASGYSLKGLLNLPSFRRAEDAALSKAKSWLERMNLTAQADRPAGDLPYGMQRRLEIARAMCTDPRLLCLDEPAAGLNPRESTELRHLLASIRDEYKIGILLIEHDMSVVMEISDAITVLDYGKRIATGTPAEIIKNPAVIRAYLGEPEGEAA